MRTARGSLLLTSLTECVLLDQRVPLISHRATASPPFLLVESSYESKQALSCRGARLAMGTWKDLKAEATELFQAGDLEQAAAKCATERSAAFLHYRSSFSGSSGEVFYCA